MNVELNEQHQMVAEEARQKITQLISKVIEAEDESTES